MDTNSILLAMQDKLPKDIQSRQVLQDRLDKLSDSQRNELAQKLPLLKLKSPALVFWVGSFLFGAFGVGRFMIGDMLLGGIRLALTIIMYVLTFVGVADIVDKAPYGEVSILYIISLVLNLVVVIWWIVDLFITGKKLRNNNLNKILQAIG